MFSGKKVPSVGGSIGIERIFTILEENDPDIRPVDTSILVTSLGAGLTAKRMETCGLLWRAGIKAETLYVEKPNADKAFKAAFGSGIPLILIIGEREIEEGVYKVRSLNEEKEYEYKKEDLIEGVKELIAANPVLLAKDKMAEKEEGDE